MCHPKQVAFLKSVQNSNMRVEAKKSQDTLALLARHGLVAADQLVIRHATIGERHGTPRACRQLRAIRPARAEHQRVEQVAFETNVVRRRSIVVGTRQRRDEVDAARRSTLDEAEPWYLDRDVDRDRRGVERRHPTPANLAS